MKKIFLIFIICSQVVFSQDTFSVDRLNSRIRFSGESVNMKNEADIGFLGIGYEVFGLSSKFPHWYFGANTYSALTGIRSGFFVFGVSTGIQKPIIKDKLSYDLGLFLGGGGGSGAPDGGGLMVRPHIDLEARISKRLSLRAGLSAVDFPSGAITSLHANVGLSLDVDTYFTDKLLNISKGEKAIGFNKINVAMLSTTLFNYKKGPLKTDKTVNTEAPVISILGLEFNRFLTNHLYATLELGGAFKGGVDGFMVYMSGLGYEIPLLKNNLFLDARALIGGAGGGDVSFGGGLAAQAEIGLGLNIKKYTLKFNYGKTFAPNGNFESDHLDIALGKTFKIYKNPKINSQELISDSEVKKDDFSFTTFNRAYFSGNKKDKNGRLYNDVFNSISFEVEKKFNKDLSVVAATVWAYQGDYGAYAEGWLGLQYYYHITDKLRATAKGLVGAGGGGGINLGSGLAYQYTLGLERDINKKWSFVANIGQVRPLLKGNFTPVLLDLGIKLNISQLVKK